MKCSSFIAIFFAIISTSTYSQTILKGRVFDAGNGKPLSGATVTYSRQGTMTGTDGAFSLECGETGLITVSFIGYTSQ
ncbi:MAG TPA: carboxypeptidase-like regulatory domain-containing protein, partial [Flavitalea sp.]|nr:carboxypeptidase-like regulatory domain-containing protein [Flavitalea sp.]